MKPLSPHTKRALRFSTGNRFLDWDFCGGEKGEA